MTNFKVDETRVVEKVIIDQVDRYKYLYRSNGNGRKPITRRVLIRIKAECICLGRIKDTCIFSLNINANDDTHLTDCTIVRQTSFMLVYLENKGKEEENGNNFQFNFTNVLVLHKRNKTKPKQNRTKQNKTKQNNANQTKPKQNETKLSKTKQNKQSKTNQ